MKNTINEYYVQNKAKEIVVYIGYKIQGEYSKEQMKVAENFVRSIIKDCDPKESLAFVEKWAKKMTEYYPTDPAIDIVLFRKQLIKMLNEAGVEIEK